MIERGNFFISLNGLLVVSFSFSFPKCPCQQGQEGDCNGGTSLDAHATYPYPYLAITGLSSPLFLPHSVV